MREPIAPFWIALAAGLIAAPVAFALVFLINLFGGSLSLGEMLALWFLIAGYFEAAAIESGGA